VDVESIPANVDAIIHLCAWRILRRASAYNLTWADLAREGRHAYMLVRGLPAETTRPDAYLSRRVTGAMLDAVRAAGGRHPGGRTLQHRSLRIA
jgi:hypothetical protein